MPLIFGTGFQPIVRWFDEQGRAPVRDNRGVQGKLRTPLQAGNREHPQKSFPAFAPLRAVRLTMAEPHCGQLGSTSDF